MAHDLLTRESPEIIRFFQDIGHITELLKKQTGQIQACPER